MITPAPSVMELLRVQQTRQTEWKQISGSAWEDSGLVFTNELGRHLMPQTVSKSFKKVVVSINCADTRFHDPRHTYAVAAIKSGDDIKSLSANS